jgi:hypothetical protein
MKINIFTLLLLFITSLTCNAQTVNGTPLKDINVKYIQIVGRPSIQTNKINLELDFGQEKKFFSSKIVLLTDEAGKPVFFNSIIDAINLLNEYGYIFIQTFSIEDKQYYLLEKTKPVENTQLEH